MDEEHTSIVWETVIDNWFFCFRSLFMKFMYLNFSLHLPWWSYESFTIDALLYTICTRWSKLCRKISFGPKILTSDQFGREVSLIDRHCTCTWSSVDNLLPAYLITVSGWTPWLVPGGPGNGGDIYCTGTGLGGVFEWNIIRLTV